MQKTINKTEGISMVGMYTITKSLIETPRQVKLMQKIDEFRDAGKPYIEFVRQLNAMCKKEMFYCKNIIPTVGRAMIANNLASVLPTHPMRIEYSALGIGTTTPTNGDTQLADETYRRQIASISSGGNVTYATAYYSATEISGLFYEHGLFCDANSAENNGVLFSRVLLESPVGVNKSLSETLTIDYTLTIN